MFRNMHPDTKIQERIVLERDETRPDLSFIEVVPAMEIFHKILLFYDDRLQYDVDPIVQLTSLNNIDLF